MFVVKCNLSRLLIRWTLLCIVSAIDNAQTNVHGHDANSNRISSSQHTCCGELLSAFGRQGDSQDGGRAREAGTLEREQEGPPGEAPGAGRHGKKRASSAPVNVEPGVAVSGTIYRVGTRRDG